MSDDGAYALVIIAMVGNPFSPGYARARRRGGLARALDYSALNVAVYGPRGAAWSLSEGPIADTDREALGVRIGSSSMTESPDGLEVEIRERTAPFGRKLTGRVRLCFETCTEHEHQLDAAGQHRWWPRAPAARVEVELDQPSLRFSGEGYHDANWGSVPLEQSFARWDWSRASVGRGAVITYDATEHGRPTTPFAIEIDRDGSVRPMDGLAPAPLAGTRWGLSRQGRTDPGSRLNVVQSLEDTPFYARAIVDGRVRGESVRAVHETLDLNRFTRRWVQALLGYRMGSLPRRRSS